MVGNAFLAEHEETLTLGTGRYWSPLRAQFQPVDVREYLMHLDIPSGMGSVRVRVHELSKR